ncbi:MAG: MerR family transcriptional regulator [Gammaproteobacteria bacterium]|nr:MerR family transcriptional regulator [Gammaproteobacteria bacterium]
MLGVEQQNTYKIGAVSRITGIGSETLRAWERRYGAVTPSRTESGDRNYSRDDVAKLLLLKSLVDAGISIGTIAGLNTEQLKSRIDSDPIISIKGSNGKGKASDNEISHVVLLGDSFPIRVLDGLPEVNGIDVVGIYEDIHEFEEKIKSSKKPDIVVIERPTINQRTAVEIQKIREVSGAWHLILIYGFSSQEHIEQIQSSQTTVVRSSVDVQELARLCIYHSGGSGKLPSLEVGSTLHFEQTIPARSFSYKQLAELSKLSKTIKCECPKHITELVRDLVAFEIYSAECQSENSKDAALHAYLHATTAQARSMLEESLSHLMRVEGISIQ